MRIPIALAVALATAAGSEVIAQDYAGTYSTVNADGVTVRLTLQQDAQGNITGSIDNGQLSGQIQGQIEQGEGAAIGLVAFQQGKLYFYGELDGSQLILTLLEPDANGNPNYESAQELAFNRATTAAQGSASPGLLGGLSGSGGQAAAPAQPGGMVPAAPGTMAPSTPGGNALDDGTPLGREWVGFLAGKKVTYMESYSSGSSGGYSTRVDVYLCSNGEFAYKDQSSVSVDVGGASGYNGGNSANSGHWHIITQGNVAGVELRFNDGRTEQYRLDYQDGATYANGTRVYVTPAEICQ
jgi:hypothetical protein